MGSYSVRRVMSSPASWSTAAVFCSSVMPAGQTSKLSTTAARRAMITPSPPEASGHREYRPRFRCHLKPLDQEHCRRHQRKLCRPPCPVPFLRSWVKSFFCWKRVGRLCLVAIVEERKNDQRVRVNIDDL